MAGHVNMMDDYLIANLPPTTLRSALRLLLSQGAATQRPFIEHIRGRFRESPPCFEAPGDLFPEPGIVSPACSTYLAQTRCMFSCKLALEALPYLDHFLNAIPRERARWTEDNDLGLQLTRFDGDVVQAVQALKESQQVASVVLRNLLKGLLFSFKDCEAYCETAQPSLPYPFTRAERQLHDMLVFLFPNDSSTLDIAGETANYIQIKVPAKCAVETFRLGPFEMPRLFNGLWQLSSASWGSGTAKNQEKALTHSIESGLSTADMADHYGDAELIYGDFRNKLEPTVRDTVYAATKWCVFSPIGFPVTTSYVLAAVKERCRRLGGRVELLQFHWYDYESKEYLDILVELVRITRSHPELISTVGLCNFDSDHVEEACRYLIAKTGSVGIVSNQVQFSLLDTRPLQKMVYVCDKYGLKLLTYGSFCGGFLSERWLDQPAPEIYLESNQLTPSQRKYLDVIRTWADWDDFQTLLRRLSVVAHKHGVSLSNVATRWVLQQPTVGAVIVGTRLGVSDNVEDNLKVFGFVLDKGDMSDINAIALGLAGERASVLFERLGDCGNEYRRMH
ncbi:aldo/keto reductase [Xylariaceae sp. FL0662B]|nr:aldo/keto reductase [Xylariaceae sp. FL0662B]